VSEDGLRDEVRSRGGGLRQDVVWDALDDIADREDVDPEALRIQSVDVTISHVVVELEVPENHMAAYDYAVSATFGSDGTGGPDLVGRDSEGGGDGQLYGSDDAGLERFDEMVATALEEADLPDGYPEKATITRPEDSEAPRTVVTVVDDHRRVDVHLAPDGSVIEVER